MGQDLKDKNITFILIVSFLVGLLCGCMMVRYRLTADANEAIQLLQMHWQEILQSQTNFQTALTMFWHVYLPTAVMALLVYGFGLWMIGQPFILSLYAFFGWLCGSYGMQLAQTELILFLLWYLPAVVGLLMLLLPGGADGIKLSFSKRSEWKRYALRMLRQTVLLGVLCAAAVGTYFWYGVGLLGQENLWQIT